MDILHRVSFNSQTDAELMDALTEMKIEYKSNGLPNNKNKFITFVIEESNPYWEKISHLIAVCNAVDLVETRFSKTEILGSEWSRLIPTFEQGYPQPKAEWPIKQLSYENVCPKCAIYQQTKPMRLAKEPSLGKNSFMSLIWAREIFCAPEVATELKKIRAKGYEIWDVLIHKTNSPSEKIRQIFIPGITSSGLIVDENYERMICPVCGIPKYDAYVKGVMRIKRETLTSGTDFLLTKEWFGYGYLAWREILVSNRVARLIIEKGWLGIRFKVVELV